MGGRSAGNLPHVSASTPAFRSDVEGLRGIAILLVVLYHVGFSFVQGGYVGVDVFFVLSGYLITGLLVAEAEATGRIDLRQFYARRMRRLLPAAIVVVAITLLAAWFIYSPIEQQVVAHSARASSAYASNIRFALSSRRYFDGASDSDPFLHTWSLAVEEQFYVVWPLMVALSLLAAASRVRRERLGWVVALTGLASFIACVILTHSSQPWAFFMVFTRWWEFALGGLAATYGTWILARARVPAGMCSMAGIAALLYSAITFDAATLFPGASALVPALGTALVLMAGAQREATPVFRLLSVPPLQWIGHVSYSWYLWHWPVLLLGGVLYPAMSLAARMLGVLLALLLATASYHLVENPVRYSRFLRGRPLTSIALGVSLTLSGIAIAELAAVAARHALRDPLQAAYAGARVDHPRLFAMGCSGDFFNVAPAGRCVFGDTAAPVSVVLLGDSHAEHWFPALDRVATERHWRLVVMVKPGCPSAELPVYNPQINRQYVECAAWRSAAVQRAEALRPALILTSNSHAYQSTVSDSIDARTWAAGLHRTLVRLARAAPTVVVIDDIPRPGFDVPICLSRAAWRGSSATQCSVAPGAGIDPLVTAGERAAVASVPGVHIVNMNDYFCDAARCPTGRGDLVLYTDDSHMTARFSASLAPALAGRLPFLVTR
ncbi:MAG: acyltransferase 3 [Gemmatimonadetes bacterium]|nr:acyltransferase 3 [Gemmatimonadota bacterium]